ncbi:MAG: AbrB/MazE/SpoVT family DNA-binding domain-containing protein [bacterium]
MTTKVHKIGNSLGIHIPKHIAEKARLQKGDPVSVEYSAGKILVVPNKKETLEDLLKSISPTNSHPLYDWGDDVGNEIIK